MRNRRGTVLLHVLVTAVLVALICASLLRMALLRSQMSGRSTQDLQAKRRNTAALDRVLMAWNQNGGVCSGTLSDFDCPGAVPGVCGCNCTAKPGFEALQHIAATGDVFPQVRTKLNASGVCEVKIISANWTNP
jgi:hypothetical protein